MEIVIIILLVVVIGFLIWDRLRAKDRWTEQSQTIAQRVGEQIADTTKVFGEVKESLGELKKGTQQIQDVGKNISSLQEILRNPKARGGFGEFGLEQILDDRLSKFYKLQYKFRNGSIVDAVVQIGDNLVPIDSKLPLDDFERMIRADSEEEKEKLKKLFIRNANQHIDVVAKYILPDEKTFDFALMYVRAENIYYEMLRQTEVCANCMKKSVFLVSPSTLYAYLQAIALGLKGLRIEKTASEILGRLKRLQLDFTSFQQDYDVVGRHIHNASSKYEEASSKLTRLGDKLQIVVESPVNQLPEGSEKKV